MTLSIELTDLSVNRGGIAAVNGIGLNMAATSWFGIIGSNGSGKTSLLRAVAGRLPISGGTCRINGADLTYDRAARAGLIGFAPPVEALPAALRARDALALAGSNLDQAIAAIGPLREALGIDALLDSWIGNCSAGMRQRLAIAAAFASGKSIVILDEPFNWLDPVASFDLKQVLQTMVRDNRLCLLTALHDLGTLAHDCDCGAMMRDGRIALGLSAADLQDARKDMRGFERRMIQSLRV